jgi:hypothetical protein
LRRQGFRAYRMDSETRHPEEIPGETSGFFRADGPDLILEALHLLRGGTPADGEAYEAAPVARQESQLCEWAKSLDLLLDPDANSGVRDTLVPFDVIPCHPRGGFLQFIAGHTLRAERRVSTKARSNL